jgi:hypothetical protein
MTMRWSIYMAALAVLYCSQAAQGADLERIRATISELSTRGSRMAGYAGDRLAADFVEGALREAGVADVQREGFEVVVPVDHGATLEFLPEGESIELVALWPNLVRTATTPPEGIEGPLFYGGQGEFADFDGHQVEGGVLLLDFNTWNNWENAASLGARAIIFIAPEQTTMFEARQKWSWVPLDVPRFWIGREEGLALKTQLAAGEQPIRIRAKVDWEQHETWNIWGIIPGTDPTLKDDLWAIQTYYDGISVAPKLTPAAESASGVAGLIELAHYFRQHPPARSVLLLVTGAHFLGQAGLKHFFNQHSRKKLEFLKKIPKRFVADSLNVAQLLAESKRRGITPDSLGVRLAVDPASGAQVFAGLDKERLFARLKQMRLLNKPDTFGIYLESDTLAIDLFLSLELSSQSDQLGVWHNTWRSAFRRFFVPLGRSFTRHGKEAAGALGRDPEQAFVNGVSPIKGLSWDSYVSEDVVVPDGIIAQSTGHMALSLMTVNDSRLVLDTPLDTPDRLTYENLQRQCALLEGMLYSALADAEIFGPDAVELRAKHDKNLKDVLLDVRGALRLLPRKSTIPTDPVPGAVVALVPYSSDDPWRPYMALADGRGNYRVEGMMPGRVQLQAFLLDEDDGGIMYATDLGERAQAFGAFEQTLAKAETQWMTILFPAESVEIYDRVHAEFLFTMGSNSKSLKVLDKRGAAPRKFGYVMGDWMSTSMLLFGDRDDSLRVIDQSVFLLNNAGATDEQSAQGRGYSLDGRRMIEGGTLEFAKNMWWLNEVRYERMRRYAIENPRVQERHQRTKKLIAKAEDAREELNWAAYVRYAREALGTENHAYKDVVATQNDVVVGIVFFVALLVPAAFFAERLLFASSDIRHQLGLTGLITFAIWILLSQVHPAFQLAHPVIVLLALIIIVMAFFVISLLFGRFNAFMDQQRYQRTGTESADISRSGTSYVAFMLGISNMRRRALRTALTLLTITLLTFTVLSFTSFEPQISFVGFDKEWQPAYHGALFHDVQWWWWDYSVYDYIESPFGEFATVVPRTWLSLGFEEGGYIPIQYEGRQVDILSLMGLSPQEPGATGVDRALVAGSWFSEDREESVLLPVALAAQLGIVPEDVGSVSVSIFGQDWRVRGLYDAARYAEIKDLNDEPLTPAKQNFAQNFMPGMEQLTTSLYNSDVDFDVSFEHLDPGRIAILPYSALESMDAKLYSVAVRFDDGVDGEGLVQGFLSRAGFRIFVGLPDEAGQLRSLAYTSLGVTSMEGLGALFIPMLIAALIVLNTMMGAVYERFREIGVYSSVGLAPVHIAFLFIAEASVYGVLGVTVGYLVGQVTAKLLIVFDMLGGVSLNYSSLSAIASSLLVMAVVLLSALYPARVASRLAVPDVVRRWQLPDPDDDVWRFSFPFTVNRQAIESLCGYLHAYFSDYSHESVGKLYTEKTRIVVDEREDGERIYSVQLLVWLAPFDMGVSQYLQFTVEPTEIKNIFGIELYIERVSGPVAFWQRLNLGFMLMMRQQFLLWQTLKASVQEDHAKVGRSVMVEASALETGEAAG